jgi:hypothetical protein
MCTKAYQICTIYTQIHHLCINIMQENPDLNVESSQVTPFKTEESLTDIAEDTYNSPDNRKSPVSILQVPEITGNKPNYVQKFINTLKSRHGFTKHMDGMVSEHNKEHEDVLDIIPNKIGTLTTSIVAKKWGNEIEPKAHKTRSRLLQKSLLKGSQQWREEHNISSSIPLLTAVSDYAEKNQCSVESVFDSIIKSGYDSIYDKLRTTITIPTNEEKTNIYKFIALANMIKQELYSDPSFVSGGVKPNLEKGYIDLKVFLHFIEPKLKLLSDHKASTANNNSKVVEVQITTDKMSAAKHANLSIPKKLIVEVNDFLNIEALHKYGIIAHKVSAILFNNTCSQKDNPTAVTEDKTIVMSMHQVYEISRTIDAVLQINLVELPDTTISLLKAHKEYLEDLMNAAFAKGSGMTIQDTIATPSSMKEDPKNIYKLLFVEQMPPVVQEYLYSKMQQKNATIIISESDIEKILMKFPAFAESIVQNTSPEISRDFRHERLETAAKFSLDANPVMKHLLFTEYDSSNPETNGDNYLAHRNK